MRQPGLLEDEHVMGAGERRSCDVIDGAGEARVEPAEHGEDERAALDGVSDGAQFNNLQLDALAVKISTMATQTCRAV